MTNSNSFSGRYLLLSVKRAYAQKIMDGTKIIEVRRTIPKVIPGDRMLLYMAAPVKGIVAELEITSLINAKDANALWQIVGQHSGIEHPLFVRYFAGAKHFCGIGVSVIQIFPTKVSAAAMRELFGITPPQSYQYLTPLQADELIAYGVSRTYD